MLDSIKQHTPLAKTAVEKCAGGLKELKPLEYGEILSLT